MDEHLLLARWKMDDFGITQLNERIRSPLHTLPFILDSQTHHWTFAIDTCYVTISRRHPSISAPGKTVNTVLCLMKGRWLTPLRIKTRGYLQGTVELHKAQCFVFFPEDLPSNGTATRESNLRSAELATRPGTTISGASIIHELVEKMLIPKKHSPR